MCVMVMVILACKKFHRVSIKNRLKKILQAKVKTKNNPYQFVYRLFSAVSAPLREVCLQILLTNNIKFHANAQRPQRV